VILEIGGASEREFMIGLGPEIAHDSGRENGGTFFGTEAVLDLMFWPRKNVGWYLEPGYGLLLAMVFLGLTVLTSSKEMLNSGCRGIRPRRTRQPDGK